jgi:hypothetical protein
MAKTKNVTVSLQLLKNIVVLLEYWDISLLDLALRDDYWDVLWALKNKLLKNDLRDAYARIVHAKDEDTRHNARIEYLQLKNQLIAVANSDF